MKKSNLKELLPMELVVEILKRVPAKWVCHIRCVCKKLLSIVDSPSFVLLHSKFLLDPDSHLPPASPQLVLRHVHSYMWPNCLSTLHSLHYHHSNNVQCAQLNLRDILQSSSSDDAHYNIVSTFCNLFCMNHQADHALSFLINTFRGEVLRLPPSHSIAQKVYGRVRFIWTGMGFDSITNTYKILRVTEIHIPNSPSADSFRVLQVLVLGTSEWRQVHSLPPFNCLSCFWNICACGDMHWLCNVRRSEIQGETHILSFDYKKEEFFWIPSLYILPDMISKLHLITFRGCMAIVDTTSGVNIEIWVMRDYNKKQWVLDYSINIHMLELDPPFEFNRAVCSEWEHSILFIDQPGTKAVFLDLTGPVVTENIFNCSIEGYDIECKRIMSLNGSLISLKSFAHYVEAREPATYSSWSQGEASGKSFFLSEEAFIVVMLE